MHASGLTLRLCDLLKKGGRQMHQRTAAARCECPHENTPNEAPFDNTTSLSLNIGIRPQKLTQLSGFLGGSKES